MAPPQVADVGPAAEEDGRRGPQQNGVDTAAAVPATASNGKSVLQELWKKNGAKAKRVVKMLRRKRQKHQKRQEQQQAGAEAEAVKDAKKELLAAVPLRSKQRDLLLPLGRNKKLKKKLEAALEADPHEAETESEDGGETESEGEGSDAENSAVKKEMEDPQVEIEFVPAEEAEGADGAVAQLAEAFADVFEKLNASVKPAVQDADEEDEEEGLGTRGEVLEFDEEDEEADDTAEKALPKNKQKRLQRPSICELKQNTARPDRIEAWDATSADPFFLAFLKGLRNVVAVPQHWSQKRRYLLWKRGFEKPPFKLPPHIEATKISEIRSALVEAESQKTMRQRMREKVRPKSNRLAIDYQVLHDCFFKHAVKPPLTKMGDLYFEGKEFLQAKKNVKPGQLSDRLREALGMGPLSPPPWLLNMQRYGPPPAYPRLRVPGLNAPIPAGASYGYQPGGWGRPPVDESGKLLFQAPEEEPADEEEQQLAGGSGQITEMWGELPPDAEVQAEDEEEEGEGAAADGAPATAETPFAGGTSSVGGSTLGLESPATLELQQRRGASSVASSGPKAYTILTPQDASVQQGQLFGVKHTYRIPTSGLPGQQQAGSGVASGVQTPAGIATPRIASGHASPFVNAPGVGTPFIGVPGPTASGTNTPLIPGQGTATPLGVTVSLNPNEMEQEGAFTADVIRQQLRQHEEAAARAKAAAGQIDPTEQRKRKSDELRGVSATAAKSKKKKQFKF